MGLRLLFWGGVLSSLILCVIWYGRARYTAGYTTARAELVSSMHKTAEGELDSLYQVLQSKEAAKWHSLQMELFFNKVERVDHADIREAVDESKCDRIGAASMRLLNSYIHPEIFIWQKDKSPSNGAQE